MTAVTGEWVAAASFAQESLWLAGELAENRPIFNLIIGVNLTMPLQPDELTEALAEVVERHESLRTYLRIDDDGVIKQVVLDQVPVEPELADLSGLSEEDRRRRIGELTKELLHLHLPLDQAPLWRAVMVRLSPGEWLLLLLAHHAIIDGTSAHNLRHEMSELCAAKVEGRIPELPDLPLQYADYAAWQREQLSETSLAYWKGRLDGLPPVHELPTDRPRPAVPSYGGGEVTFQLGPELLAGVEALARRHRGSTLTVLQAGLAALLQRLSGQSDIATGVLVAGRDRAEFAPLIGVFVNTVVVRSDVSGDPTFEDLLRRQREVILDAFEHQEVPFHKVVEAVAPRRDPGVHPLFQVSLNHMPRSGTTYGKDTARHDLAFEITPGECRLEYSTDLFDHETARQLAERYVNLLADAVARPDRRVSELSLLLPGEYDWLVHELNDTALPYPEEATLHGLFEEQVARTPEAPALTFQGETITYAELDTRANRIANALLSRGVGAETPVGVCADRSFELIAALFGILKAGGVYVPLDPDYPAGRLAHLVEEAEVRLVLAQRDLFTGPAEVLLLDAIDPCDAPPAAAESAAALAYVVFTSGSTGKPKGVMTPHGAVVNYLHGIQRRVGLGPGDAVLQKTVMSADGSIREIIWPLVTGARLVLAEPGAHRDAFYLADIIRRERVTVAIFVPSMLAFLDLSGTALRCLISVGEVLPTQLANRLMRALPDCELVNIYGPTETTMTTTWGPVSFDHVPLGEPLQNTTLYVLDALSQPQPPGVTGELCIGGVQLARGYRGRPALTAAHFVPDPYGPPGSRLYRTGDLSRRRPDGTLEFLGRRDGQVKLRGMRVELGEIEGALRALPGIRDVAVLVREDSPGDQRLVAYLATAEEQDPAVLRAQLREVLPEHMVPGAFVTMERFPQTATGKLDRKVLPVPDARRPSVSEPPRTADEQEIAAVWTEVLGIGEIGVDDDFFELGGHSLLAMRVVAKLRGRQISVMDLFRNPTVRQLAALSATDSRSSGLLHELTAPLPPEDRRVSYVCVPYGGGSAVAYVPLAQALPYGHSLYSVAIPGHDLGLDQEALPFDELAERCAAEVLREVEGPIVLYGHCGVGGALTIALAQLLEAAGREVLAVYAGAVFPSALPPGRFSRFLSWVESKSSNRRVANWLKGMGVDMDELDPAQADRVVANMRGDTRKAEEYFTRLLSEGATPLRAPVISVTGEHDPATEFAQERFAEWGFITGTTALVELKEAGHYFVKHRAAELAAIVTTAHTTLSAGSGSNEEATWSIEAVSHSVTPAAPTGMGRFLAVTAGQLVTLVGSAITQWAVPVWIFIQTGSYGLFGLIGFLTVAPGLIVMPLAGALADRHDRRRILLLSSLAAAVCEGLMLLSGTQLGVILTLVGLLSIASTFQRVTYLASIAQLAPKRYLGHANGVAQLMNGTAMLMAPLLAAGMLAAIGFNGILVADIVSYVAAIGVLLLVRFPDVLGRRRREPLLTELAEGLRYSWGNRGFRALVIYFTVVNLLLAAPFFLVTPLVLAFGSTADAGLAGFAEGLGFMVGGLVMAVWGGPRRRRMFQVMVFNLVTAGFIVVMGLRPNLALICFGMFGMSVWLGLGMGTYQTIVQVKVPQRFHGRVFSINQAISWAAFPIGFAILSPLSGSLLEPLFAPGGALAGSVGAIIGTGPGRGLAFAYLLSGVGLAVAAAVGLGIRRLARLDVDMPDAVPDDLVGLQQLAQRRAS